MRASLIKPYSAISAWNGATEHQPPHPHRSGGNFNQNGEYRAPRVRNGTGIRTVDRTLVNSTLDFSRRGDTRRTGHGSGEHRFTVSTRGTSVPAGGGFFVFAASFCGIGYRSDLLEAQYRIFTRSTRTRRPRCSAFDNNVVDMSSIRTAATARDHVPTASLQGSLSMIQGVFSH
jgi:hypothetical protein